MPFLYVMQAGMNAETTGSLIAKIQEERKMTQAQLAELVHVRRSCQSEGKRHRRECAGYLLVHTSCRLSLNKIYTGYVGIDASRWKNTDKLR